MAIIIGTISQKGGVGKSSMARLIAGEYAKSQWAVKIADIDTRQGTVRDWQTTRIKNRHQPEIAVELFSSVEKALGESSHYDMMILDGAPKSDRDTLEIAKGSDFVILPTATGADDLRPTIKLAHGLKREGIPTNQIGFVLWRTVESESEINAARNEIEDNGYQIFKEWIPTKTGYLMALDKGLTVAETSYDSLNKRALRLVKEINKRVQHIEEQE